MIVKPSERVRGRRLLGAVVVLAMLMFGLVPSSQASSQVVEGDPAAMLPQAEPRQFGPRIINGTDLPQGQIPSLVSLQQSGFGHICGGSLIATQVVITAAHCVATDGPPPQLGISPSQLSVGLGSPNLGTFEQVIGVDQIVFHPDYEGFNFAFRGPTADIALLILSAPAVLGPNVQTIFVGTDPVWPAIGDTPTVAGWGDIDPLPGSSNETYPMIAKFVEVQVVGCSFINRLVGHICASGPGTNDSCGGDSGGPLIDIFADGTQVLRGIVSSGPAHCGTDVGLYERTATYLDWIQAVLGPFVGTNGFVPLSPSRILDSRPGQPGQGFNDNYVTPWESDFIRAVQVTGVGGVPTSGVTAVLAHVTSVSPTADSFSAIWAAGLPNDNVPTTAAKNYGVTGSGPLSHAGVTNDAVILPVGPDGTTLIYNAQGTSDLVIDVIGYFDLFGGGDQFSPLAPSRILDSRPGQAGQGTNNTLNTPWGPAVTRSVQVTGVGGVPASGVSAVAVQVTSVSPTANSYLTAWPDGQRPTTAVKNFGPSAGGSGGHTAVANDLVILPVGAGGTVQFYNNAGSVDFVVDVVGWFGPTATTGFYSTSPRRILDSRPSQPSMGRNTSITTPWGAGETRAVHAADIGPVPPDATSILAHVTSVSPTANSFLTAWGTGSMPLAAGKNFGPSSGGPLGHTALTNDLMVLPIDSSGNVQFFNNAGTVDFVIDVVGYMVSPN